MFRWKRETANLHTLFSLCFKVYTKISEEQCDNAFVYFFVSNYYMLFYITFYNAKS